MGKTIHASKCFGTSTSPRELSVYSSAVCWSDFWRDGETVIFESSPNFGVVFVWQILEAPNQRGLCSDLNKLRQLDQRQQSGSGGFSVIVDIWP